MYVKTINVLYCDRYKITRYHWRHKDEINWKSGRAVKIE